MTSLSGCAGSRADVSREFPPRTLYAPQSGQAPRASSAGHTKIRGRCARNCPPGGQKRTHLPGAPVQAPREASFSSIGVRGHSASGGLTKTPAQNALFLSIWLGAKGRIGRWEGFCTCAVQNPDHLASGPSRQPCRRPPHCRRPPRGAVGTACRLQAARAASPSRAAALGPSFRRPEGTTRRRASEGSRTFTLGKPHFHPMGVAQGPCAGGRDFAPLRCRIQTTSPEAPPGSPVVGPPHCRRPPSGAVGTVCRLQAARAGSASCGMAT